MKKLTIDDFVQVEYNSKAGSTEFKAGEVTIEFYKIADNKYAVHLKTPVGYRQIELE